jgi:hypothetical protein
MTVALALLIAGLGVGMFSGVLLMAIYIHARVSLAQERMQRIVRYWQAEARAQWTETEAEAEPGQRPWANVANPPMDPWGS